MASITVYTFEDADGSEGSYETQDPREAQNYGRRTESRVVANEFVWDDSTTAWDFRPAYFRVEGLTAAGVPVVISNQFEDESEAIELRDIAGDLPPVSTKVLGAVFGREDYDLTAEPVASLRVARFVGGLRDEEYTP